MSFAVIVQGISPPKIHDLAALLILVDGEAIPASVRPVTGLTRFAVISRYPADFGELDDDEWSEAVALARTTVAWASGIVGG